MTLNINRIRAAAARISGHVKVTPLIESQVLNSIVRTRVFLKAESLQKAGAFKFRGAMNKILCLTEEERGKGVIAFSSGNHALSVSLAASELGISAVVLMPKDAPEIKIEGARKHGAEVILYDRVNDDREAMCASLISARGLTLVPPYDDYDVMAGAGSGALEAIEQLPSEAEIDAIAVCCSGGGLTSGWATTAHTLLPNAKVLAVEPQHFDDTGRSLRMGSRVSNASLTGTICDALLVPSPGQLTFEVMQKTGVQGVTVSDQEVRDAMKFAFEHLKLVLEPGGAAALAAVLSKKLPSEARGVLVILSGANVDKKTFFECICT